LETPLADVALPVPAATIILLRETPVSPEVLMIRRSVKSEFLPDLYVFPGGRVDEPDHELADRTGEFDAERAATLAATVDPKLALGFYVAAIRETYEEAGILLARRRGETQLIDESTVKDLGQHRLAVQDGSMSFRDVLEREDLDLAVDLLALHAHWITPQMMPHRYDTLFFAASTPLGQLAAHDGFESTAHVWIRPEEALEQAISGERQMVFPTKCNLETLCGHPDVDAAVAASAARPVVPILPTVEKRDGTPMVVIPEEAAYPTSAEPAPRRPPKPA
jgi:8-oxo-dGTP pyrophosphatase MutT (NUDIX family)